MACYLFEKKKIPYKSQIHHEKMFHVLYTINDPLPAEIEFKKKKKIINDQTIEYQFSTFF